MIARCCTRRLQRWLGFTFGTPASLALRSRVTPRGDLLSDPLRHEPAHIDGAPLTCVDHMTAPRPRDLLLSNPAIPAHLGPRVLQDDIGTVSMINHMVAHPLREGEVVGNEALIITPCDQPSALRLFRSIKQTDDELLQLDGGWCRQDF